MSMVTSCPSCATTFRVLQEQLRARQGKVRCGKCSEVFDAFKTLASFPDGPSPEATPARIEFDPLTPTTRVPVQTTLDIGSTTAEAPTEGTAAGLSASHRTQAAHSRGWFIVAVVLAALLVLQLLYAVRAPLSSLPGMRPLFERVCAITGCTVSLPRRTEGLAIESSDLQFDPARTGVIVLTAVLRNRGSAPVEHPALELTLTNAQDQAVARRIFLPKDYLERAADVSTGMGARAEVNVRIELDTGDLKAAGYRLFLFYP